MPLQVSYDAYAGNKVIPHAVASNLYEQVFGILGFGPAGSGTANDTATFVKAMAYLGRIGDSGKPTALYLPDGLIFLVDLDYLPAPNLVRVWGGGRLLSTSSPGVSSAFFTGGHTTGFSVRGIEVEAADDKAVLVKLSSSSSVKVVDVELTNARILEAGTDLNTNYAGADTGINGNCCRDITVSGCTARRVGANLTSQAAVLLHYTIGGVVSGNRVDGYPYGLQFWGGDANPAIDGALANERKAKNLTFTGNTVTNILDVLGGGAAIWGSMGEGITITANTAKNCADVGLDLEGCKTGTVTGNTSIDCPNGTLATFSFNEGVIFSGNICVQHVDGSFMVRVQNASGTTGNKRVTFSGNDMSCVGGQAWVPFETTEHGIFKGNTTHNVRFDSKVNNQRWTVVTDNDMSFDEIAGAAFAAIQVGQNHIGGRTKVARNTIGSLVTQPAGTRAIYSFQDDPNDPVTTDIIDNECINMGDEPIEIVWDGGNPGTPAYSRAYRNNLGIPGAVIVVTETGVGPHDIVVAGNHDDTNALWP